MTTISYKNKAERSRITSQFRKILLPIVCFFLSFGLILFLYAEAELNLEIESTVSGTTQFFYPSKKDTLSEEHTYVSNLPIGRTKLVVPIPLSTQWLRWDPINGSGEFRIASLYIKLPFFEVPIPSNYVTANFQIAKLAKDTDGIFVSTSINAGDPSVRIQLPWQKVLLLQLLATFILTSLIFAVISMIWQGQKKGKTFLIELGTLLQGEALSFHKLPLLILIACSFWLLSLTSYSISIDDEYAAFRLDHRGWVAQGRWTVYLLSKFILPQHVIPFLPNLIFCISVAFSYLVIMRAHVLKLDWKGIILFPIFMAFPTWYFIAEFYANLPAVSLGLIFSSLALLIFSRSMSQLNGSRVRRMIFLMLVALQGGLLGTAIGTYQSYLLAFFSMGLGLIIFNMARDSAVSFLDAIKQIAYLCLVACTGFIFYFLVSLAFKTGLGCNNAYIDGFVNPNFFLERPLFVIMSTLTEATQIYTGSRNIFGVSLSGLGGLIALGFVALSSSLPNWKQRILVLILLFACIVAPFSLNFLAGGATRVPYRSMVGVPYVIWLFAALTFYRGNVFIKVLAIFAITVSTFQLVNAHATYNAATQLALEHDKALSAEIYHRITEKLPENRGLTNYKVDFYGARFFSSVFPKIQTSTIGHSFFDWDGGNPNRIVTFMRLIGYDEMETVNSDQRKELTKYYNEMPIWPSMGAIRQVGDIFLVKLSNRPGLTHQF